MSRIPLGNAYAGTKTFADRMANLPGISLDVMLELPEVLEPGNDRIKRITNRAAKTALREVMLKHHKTRIPDHFKKSKQKKYNYAKRSPATLAIKAKTRRENMPDLVKRGRLSRKITQRIDVNTSGKASAGDVSVIGKMRMPPMRPDFKTAGVTMAVMIDEIERMTTKEQSDIAFEFVERYIAILDKEIKGKKVRRRLSKQLSSLGINP